MTDCTVCNHPRAFEIMAKVFAGDLTYVEASKVLQIPTPTVFHCFANHWTIEADGDKVTLKAVQQAETVEDFVTLLRKSIKNFIRRLNQAMEMPVSAYNETAVTKLSAELRALMRDILEFEGKLKTAPMVQLTILQLQMTKLTAFLFSELCPGDREKLMKVLPELMSNGAESNKQAAGMMYESTRALTENPPST